MCATAQLRRSRNRMRCRGWHSATRGGACVGTHMVAHTHHLSPPWAARSRIVGIAAALMLACAVLLPSAARAQGTRDSDACARQSAAPPEHEARIAACSRVIAASRSQGTRAAAAYHNRGVAYAALGQHERAIQDYDQAIRLNPRNAVAFND